ncbi:hypothetical protein J2T55_001840 [Methylohalomonas lacus]|uniref:Uncharacterized protein n=1 Tax=Methylohalomonas lacus TaxID=398773 RepID=A0AAE3HNM7_9GAMM|nr:hypothetical protein [Methylohalomonas lacus]MCS3903808.1 hypothetical protein [Methylohalomonas lacus]
MTAGVDADAVRAYLRGVARRGRPVLYRDAARELALEPPHTIHQLALLLEQLMVQDAQADVPLIAALVVSKQRNGLPAPGFFARARELGRYQGPDTGIPAREYHAAELKRAVDYWG